MLLTIYNTLSAHRRDWAIGITLLCLAILLSFFAHDIFFRLLARFRPKYQAERPLFATATQRLRRPARWIVILTAIGFSLPWIPIPPNYTDLAHKALGILWFLALGWFMISAVYMVEDLLLRRYDVGASDNLRARRVRTQMQFMRRISIFLLLLIDAGLILSLFHDSKIWHYGAGLLASAGLASLVLATAAKSTASNLLAGLQIAFTEPIRIDDVVVVQGQFGRVEEITTGYVVIAVWDQRKLIVPLSYFIENSFENWTRNSSDLIGTSFLYVDYSIPVEALRQEFTRILESSTQWDRRINALQVTNLSEHTMEIRCLMSARNSGQTFDLRCIVREKMIDFIQKNYPDAFPRTRFSAISQPESGNSFPSTQPQS
ncbi:mechanosensitive ion channel [Alloacidobacterium dinghuense]|uniref:Mechanosensitive ion channel n=1 Tax=Alloacidobacterium dinghuense TaxID=2763107 RepID=A0A7G8BLE4_9BACT|nr:mechanosensitive ion channel domain-containing protein [Alloacidobacterium dinghuense]QNI33364.1 mechanosensitive ion channel [Alloacidobacterium dinghuense]